MDTNLTPEGIQDLNPSETEAQIRIIKCISKVFDTRQFNRIKTPTIESFDSLSKGMGETLKKNAIKFFDPKGETLILRPDHTTPIARLVATRMKEDKLPLKLAYIDPVFRNSQNKLEGNIEQVQAGIEIIGDGSAQADSEALLTLINCLKSIPNLEFAIDIGHTSFTEGLSEEKKEALIKGDFLTYGEIPERGDASIITDKKDLYDVMKTLKAEGVDNLVTVNKGLVKDIHYYTGIIFEAYDIKRKKPIASGGRYDNLLAKFGYNQPAVGFAINIENLEGCDSC